MGKPAQWNEAYIPSQAGRIAIVTGANSGIGYVTALCLAKRGEHVILACRNESRGRKAEKDMRTSLDEHSTDEGGSVQLMLMDLSSLASASQASRVVNVGSLLHRWADLDFPTLVDATDHSWGRYGRSKLLILLFTFELARRLESAHISNVKSVAAHPGVAYSGAMNKVIQRVLPRFLHSIVKTIASSLPIPSSATGALPILYAATVEDVRNGEYFGPARFGNYPVKETPAKRSQSMEDAARLWTMSEELTKHSFSVA
ncbi:hypothetical protein Poli38472_005420 [Pythium oligandrum]|uniref:Uncharacterized protein n=1 Tax=Pythium oligandrum TaxID=41045 RepID=A0A8K1CIJ6_PYTOL|nr:hypothetical protein Poli38472_005420 [Pythium oligandrum]|eukprot:TMW62802.1 hypothetical protein Poli38472_005420 [Pythium oligandrum]